MINYQDYSKSLDNALKVLNNEVNELESRICFIPPRPKEETKQYQPLTQDELTKRHGLLAYAIY